MKLIILLFTLASQIAFAENKEVIEVGFDVVTEKCEIGKSDEGDIECEGEYSEPQKLAIELIEEEGTVFGGYTQQIKIENKVAIASLVVERAVFAEDSSPMYIFELNLFWEDDEKRAPVKVSSMAEKPSHLNVITIEGREKVIDKYSHKAIIGFGNFDIIEKQNRLRKKKR